MTPRVLVISTHHILKLEELLSPLTDQAVELFFVSDPARGVQMAAQEPFTLIIHDQAIVLPKTKAKIVPLTPSTNRDGLLAVCKEVFKHLDITPLRPM